MTRPSDADWVGLLLVTEAARKSERPAWGAICAVVRNRVASHRYPNTVEAVILQRYQFSRFSDWFHELDEGGPDAVWNAALAWVVKGGMTALLHEATDFAAKALALPAGAAPFGPRALYYFSPVSMKPAGKRPWWWEDEVAREVPVPGVDPRRFVFGEARRP